MINNHNHVVENMIIRHLERKTRQYGKRDSSNVKTKSWQKECKKIQTEMKLGPSFMNDES